MFPKVIMLKDGEEISVQPSQSKKGLVLFCIEDEAFCLTDEEAEKIGKALIESARASVVVLDKE